MRRINQALNTAGIAITAAVGTMWMAVAFAALTFVSLPGVIAQHNLVDIVQWVAQTFLQLVLLSVIMVGQNAQGVTTERMIRDTHGMTIEELQDLRAIAQSLHVAVTGDEHPGLHRAEDAQHKHVLG